MTGLLQDLRLAWRMLLKRPGFTLILVVTLALGIGANSAIFSVVNALFLRPLPYSDGDQLVTIWAALPTHGLLQLNASAPEFVDYRDRNQSFSGIAAYASLGRNLTGGGEPERINTTFVTNGFFEVLGMRPLYGRSFITEEDQPGNNRVVVLSYSLWKRHFPVDSNPVGQSITLDGVAHTVVGVMPQNFNFPDSETQLWKPMGFDADDLSDNNRGSHYLSIIARIKPGLTIEQTNGDLATIARTLQNEHPTYYEEDSGWTVAASRLHEELVGEARQPLLMSLAVVAFVLLIACANIANLLLGRAASRRREVAIRIALGASRWQLIRQLLLESLLLSVVGGVVGILLAAWSRDLLTGLMPVGLQHSEVPLDATVILFTTTLSLITGFLFGLAPAIQSSKLELTESLKESATATTDVKRRHSLRRLLVISEMALAMLLLVGAGLMIKSLYKLQRVELGFNPSNVLTMRLSLPRTVYTKPYTQRAVFDGLMDRLHGLPNVKSVGIVNYLPLSGSNNRRNVTVEGAPENPTNVEFRLCSSDYFKVLGISPVAGRLFDDGDRQDTLYVAVVNQAFVKVFLDNQNPLGKRIRMGGGLQSPFRWLSVVGVIKDIKHKGPDADSAPEMYIPYLQPPLPDWNVDSMFVAVRTEGEPIGAISAVSRAVREVDKELPIYSVQTMEQLLSKNIAPRRFNMQLISLFSALALLLASIGIYGVMSFSVAQRTKELGIRMALGARAGNILSLILREGIVLALLGGAIGVVAALLLAQLMTKLLFGIAPRDITSFAAAAFALFVVAFLACYLPARRATKVDPLVALRYE